MQPAPSALVVDRSSMVAETVAMALQMMGYRSESATSFREARRLFQQMPALTLLIAHADVGDDRAGGRLLHIARSHRSDLPVIVISSRSRQELPPVPEDVIFLRKPFDRSELVDAISRAKAVA
jgi:twitching motility two-component system response regulator PilG